ncbi:MAG: MopE-related protein [Kofleriaceae bacterium]
MPTWKSSLLGGVVALALGCGPSSTLGDLDGGPTPTCEVGEVQACYSGLPGTDGVGDCRAGEQACGDDRQWGPCLGQVTPTSEVCGNGGDENCNGQVDEDVDLDGDGYTTCGGDCCDSTADGCASPTLVNPGAFEADGNGLDDDCDGGVDNVAAASCDTGLASNSADGLDYGAAMELCQRTTDEPGATWGLISATFSRPSGSGNPDAAQRSIRTAFGATVPRAGASFAVLSTGHAAAPGQTMPGFVDFQDSSVQGDSSAVPADWLAANGGDLPNAPGCPPPDDNTARDPIMLTLRLRVPTNAQSFTLATNFMSAEYPEWVCSPYNDFFVVLLDSSFAGTPANPADKNLAIYTAPDGGQYPVGVNLAFGDTGLFQQCENGATGCADPSVAGNVTTCVGTAELVGTGMDVQDPDAPFPDDPGVCGNNDLLGGGTGFLETRGNVVPGEIITLRIALWDTSDGYYDSVAILDSFRWGVEPSQPGTVVVD